MLLLLFGQLSWERMGVARVWLLPVGGWGVSPRTCLVAVQKESESDVQYGGLVLYKGLKAT